LLKLYIKNEKTITRKAWFHDKVPADAHSNTAYGLYIVRLQVPFTTNHTIHLIDKQAPSSILIRVDYSSA
jgi:hypothetical protein